MADHSMMKYMGRIPLDTEGNALFSWAGRAVKIKFQGTSLSATLSGINAKVAFYIDGTKQSPLYKISRNNETVVIAENLTPGIHEIIIRKASLVDDAVVKFHGIITDGELLPPENKCYESGKIIHFYLNEILTDTLLYNKKKNKNETT